MPVFQAHALSIHELFISEGNNIGFRVPEYQRTYDWGEENIRRYFEDLVSGLMERAYETHGQEQTLTFLGTIILVDEGSHREHSFDGRSFSIVDGQQRLTTASLLALRLHDTIVRELPTLETVHPTVADWLKAESQHVLKRLGNCIYGNLQPDGVNNFPYPRIVRGEDNRAGTQRDSEYQSLIANYLFSYAEHLRRQTAEPFSFHRSAFQDGTSDRFFTNIESIDLFISNITSSDNEAVSELEAEPLTQSDFRRAPIVQLFNKLPDDQDERNRVLSLATDHNITGTLKLLRLLCFAVYTIDSVLVTRVQTSQEKYAFDIFDALNTTGEPLTAIETFKPRITLFESRSPRRGYNGSPSEAHLRLVEDYLGSFQKNSDRQSEAQDIVVSFALYLTGKKCSRHLNTQRRYLRTAYGRISDRDFDEKRSFVKALADVSEFRRKFWSNSDLQTELFEVADRGVVLACLALLRGMNNSLTIPIIARYYVAARDSGDHQALADAIRAITAFVVFRRSATGGTAGIDSILRAIMARGFPARDSTEGLYAGVSSDRALPSVDRLKAMLRDWLTRSPTYINGKDDWLRLAAAQGLYISSKPLCRFILLAAAHNARPKVDRPSLLVKTRVSQELEYLSYRQWTAKEHETIEHIAPINDPSRNWDHGIYAQPLLKHTIGNLILLPTGENSAVGNKPWEIKRLFYQAFSAENEGSVREVISEAENRGVDFGKTRHMLLNNVHLPGARTIAVCERWTAEEISNRTQNILELAWEEMGNWLFE